MKEIDNGFVILLTGLLLVTSPVLSMTGADYELSWSTIDGGGGRSTGGDFALVGTISQPDAGEMEGGDFTLAGGFWPPLFSPAILQCFVDFEHFAEFAKSWLDTPCDVGNAWCGGADLDSSGSVDLGDIGELAYWWLNDCPPDWPWN